MFRKTLGVVTTAAAGLLLVGVAWAAGDGVQDISGSGAVATADSSLGTTGSSTPATTGTSIDDGSTSTSMDDNSTTSIGLVDTSSTSTTLADNTTSTSIDDTTSTSIDDHNRGETRGPAPVNTSPTSYQVGTAGTVTVQISGGQLVLLSATPASGWHAEVDRADGEEIRVEFENGEADAEFEATAHNGELRVRVESD